MDLQGGRWYVPDVERAEVWEAEESWRFGRRELRSSRGKLGEEAGIVVLLVGLGGNLVCKTHWIEICLMQDGQ